MGMNLREGKIFPLGKDGGCLLAGGEPCPYFERLVLPLADITTDPLKWAERNEARSIYTLKHSIGARGPIRRCPDCDGERSKGHSRCPKCAKRRRLEAERARMRKRRQKEGAAYALSKI